jgi:hypothetical protein
LSYLLWGLLGPDRVCGARGDDLRRGLECDLRRCATVGETGPTRCGVCIPAGRLT